MAGRAAQEPWSPDWMSESGEPGSVVADNLAILVDIHFLAQVENVVGIWIAGEEVVRYLHQFAIDPFLLADDAGERQLGLSIHMISDRPHLREHLDLELDKFVVLHAFKLADCAGP